METYILPYCSLTVRYAHIIELIFSFHIAFTLSLSDIYWESYDSLKFLLYKKKKLVQWLKYDVILYNFDKYGHKSYKYNVCYARSCVMYIGSCPILHSADRCLTASYAARYSTHSTDRQLNGSGQVSLTDRCPLAWIRATLSCLGSSSVKVHLCSSLLL